MMPLPALLGIPAWAWLTGGGLGALGLGAVVIDQAGDAAEQIGEATEKATGLSKVLLAGGALYVSYAALKSSGVIK